MKKRLLVLLMALFMLFGLAPGAAWADVTGSTDDGTVNWVFTDDGTLTFSGTGSVPSASIWGKDIKDNKNVAEISNVKNVIINNGITGISDSAFNGCLNLISISIANGVADIGTAAFMNCSSLANITIPKSVTSIGELVFYGCSCLTSIDVANENSAYCSIDGVLFDKNKTVIIKFPQAKNYVNYIIPDTVTRIEDEAFYGCSSLESITIPDDVTSIGYESFYGCSSLANITIPKNVTSIGNLVFYGCSSLTSIDVANENSSYCSIDGVLFNKNKTIIIINEKSN